MTDSLGIRTMHFRYWFLMLLICFMIIVRNIFAIQFPIFLFLPFGIAIGYLCTREEIIAFICSMSPFETTFQFRYMILIGAAFLLIKSKKIHLSNLLPILLMMLCELLHFIGEGLSLASFLREFSVLVTIGIIISVEPIDSSSGLPMRSLASMVFFASIISLFVNKRLTGYTIASSARLGSTYDMVESYNALLNPNVGSFLCVLSICGLLLINKKGNSRKSDIFLIIGLSIFIFLFQSKAAIICLAFVLIIPLYVNHRNWIIPSLRAVGILSFFTIIGFVFFRNTMNGIISRFLAEDFSSGRIKIYKFYHDYLFSKTDNILFGKGLFNYADRIASEYPPSKLAISGAVTYINHHMTLVVSHNNIQEIILVWGVPGFFLMLWLLYKIVKHKKMNRNIMNYLSFDYVLLYTLQGQLISSSIALLALVFSLVCMEFKSSDTNKKSVNNLAKVHRFGVAYLNDKE